MGHRSVQIGVGVILIVGGLLAFLAPFAASLTATLIVGWSFFVAGILHIVQAVRTREHRAWNGGFGALELLLGASFVLNPFAGLVSLTLVLGALFFAAGLMQLYLAWVRRSVDSVWLLGLSGVLSLALAVMIAFNLGVASASVPGLLLGVELVSTGIAFVMLRPKTLRQQWRDATT